MGLISKFFDAFSDTRVIAEGKAAGLRLATLNGDPKFARGTYEGPVQEEIISNLGFGDVFYDIGANVGFFSLLAARCVGPQGCVYSFEPVPRNAAAIARSAKLNGLDKIDVIAKAVGASEGDAELLLARHIGGAALSTAGAPPDLRGRIVVDVVTLDGVIAQRDFRPPTLVKIDVEGAEMDVLLGMKGTLAAHRPKVIYEIDDANRDGIEHKAREIAAFMTASDYMLTHLPPSYANDVWQVEHILARPCVK